MKMMCNHGGCKQPATYKSRCDKHQITPKSNGNKFVFQDKSYKEYAYLPDGRYFYNTAEWKRLSKYCRQKQPLCEWHLGIDQDNPEIVPMAHVDHWIELQDSFELRLDPDNMVCLCQSCHQFKGNEIQRYRTKGQWKKLKNFLIEHKPTVMSDKHIEVLNEIVDKHTR
ncbi:putative enzyme [Vibrio owensii]|uniref:Enzyme n=1 Tax=Vibrio owensii TaxID=696485 RepID=A0AAU9Q4I3_9VIBR|nr:putative enzyme [Vibrio owensii]